MRARFTLGILAALAAVEIAPASALQHQPTFRAATNLIEIDAVVTDKDGHVVRGLTKDDFKVVEDGKAQQIAQFSFVDLPIVAPTAAPAMEVPSDVVTNVHARDSRMYAIVLDGFHVDASRSTLVRRQARQFVQDFVGPNDLAAVLTLGTGTATRQFTSNKALVYSAIDRFIGRKSGSTTSNLMKDELLRPQNQGVPEDPETGAKASEAKLALAAITQVCRSLGAETGRRRSIVLFSEGIELDTSDFIGEDKRPGAGSRELKYEASKYAADVLTAQQEMFDAARRANVAVYAIDPRGNSAGDEDLILRQSSGGVGPSNEARRSQGTLRTFAEQTGGLATVNTSDAPAGFARIVEANSSYYVLGYASTNPVDDGRYRKISVSVERPGVTVVARKGYYAIANTKSAALSIAAPGANSTAASPRIRQLLANALPVAGLGVEMTGGPLRSEGSKVLVAFALEIDTTSLPFTERNGALANDIEIAWQAIDANGKMQAANRSVGKLQLPLGGRSTLASRLRYAVEFPVPPGRYQVRAAVIESAGDTGGSALLDVDAVDFTRAALSMSALLVTATAARSTPTTGSYPELARLLAAAPTTARVFAAADTITALAIINEGGKPHGNATVAATVTTPDGREMFRNDVSKDRAELAADKHGFPFVAQIPLSNFAPGRYVLRITATPETGNSVARAIPFTVR